MSTHKPIGTVQVDVDDLWVYYQSIGRNAPDGARALIYEQGIPRLLELFERHSIRATFFVVGRMAIADPETPPAMRQRAQVMVQLIAPNRPKT